MKLTANNIFKHADGDWYCLLSNDAPMKCPISGDWLDGVIYTGADGRMRSTTLDRWTERFTEMPYYDGDDADVQMMIRRCNPGDRDLDFLKVFESWHESEMGITGHMLELAVACAVEQFVWIVPGRTPKDIQWDEGKRPTSVKLTIATEDLQRVAQNYEIEKVAEPHSFTFHIRKSFP